MDQDIFAAQCLLAMSKREAAPTPPAGIEILSEKINDDGTAATVTYRDLSDGREKTLELALREGRWMVIWTKRPSDRNLDD